MSKTIAIIGGGAAGLVAAIVASENGAKVDIYEQNDKLGKKILASGNGRCNISNTTISVDDYYGNNPSFVKNAINRFGFLELERFFESIGLMLDIKDSGKVYPLSNEAKSVQMSLINKAKALGVKFITETKVEKITKKGQFTIADSTYDKILITTGSGAAPLLGADESGMDLAISFGHKKRNTYASLVGLESHSPFPISMSGAKTYAQVTLYIDKKLKYQTAGDVLFTKYGLSGFAILDISQKASVSLEKDQAVTIGLNLLPTYERTTLNQKLGKLSVLDIDSLSLLSGFIPTKIALTLLKSLNMDSTQHSNKLNKKQISQITNLLIDWRFDIHETHGFKHAEVSGGGIDTQDIDKKTYESLLIKDLYFAGEVLDIVGKRGGYNLHFAFASGALVGESLSR